MRGDSITRVTFILAVFLMLLPAMGMGQPSVTSDVVATVNGEPITRGDLLEILARAKGGDIFDHIVQLKLVEQEMGRRRITVSEDAVDERIRIMNQSRQAMGQETYDEILRREPALRGPFRHGVRMKVAMEIMAKADLQIPENRALTNLKLERWYKRLKDRAEIVGRREALPPGAFASVNGEIITMDEFNELLWMNSTREERQAALDTLIKRILVKQALEKKGLVVTETDLDAELIRLERAYSRSAEYKGLDLDTILRQQGMAKAQLRADPDFRAAVGLRKLVRADLTEEQARRFFKAHELEYSGGELRVSQIFLSVIDTRTGAPKDAKTVDEIARKADDLKRQLDAGADFAELARRYSEDRASAAQGGDIGFIPRFGKLVEPLSAAIFALKKGEVSQPIATPVGFYLFKVTDLRPGKKTDFESVRNDVYDDLINAESEAWFARLQKEARIEKKPL